MRVPFIKMHGLGNDFVVLDAREGLGVTVDTVLARALANRHTGIGCDQLILLEPSATADFRMRIFNPDGGEVEACGNATRAVGLLHGKPARIETLGGELASDPAPGGIAVDMGTPRFGWDEIPLAYAMDTLTMPVGWEDLDAPTAVNVGNPHVIFFVPDCEAVELDRPELLVPLGDQFLGALDRLRDAYARTGLIEEDAVFNAWRMHARVASTMPSSRHPLARTFTQTFVARGRSRSAG